MPRDRFTTMASTTTRRFTQEEKHQLLANLDLEVADRVRQFEASLLDALSAFKLRAESQILRIPKPVRDVTMREFADKWDGDVQACLRGLMLTGREDIGESGREERKRKWVESVEADDAQRATKTARVAPASPRKKPSTATVAAQAQPGRVTRTPSKWRLPLSPRKPTSPSKSKNQSAAHRMPSSSTFAPTLPARTPAYPRVPRKDESMLSLNGSPLLNPYSLVIPEDGGGLNGKRQIRRTNSISIQPDSSLTATPSKHPGPTSQPASRLHSRSNSESIPPASALISIPTLDGHLLSFDALTTSPSAFDALEGISESSKKAAKDGMRRLVEDVIGKWKIG